MRYDPIYLHSVLAQSRNAQAFLNMIRYGEGTAGEDGYRVIFGGSRFAGADGIPGTFDDFADHPRQYITRNFRSKGKIVPLTSSAAGAYQFLERTWDGLVKQYGFKDFTPKTQDIAALALIAGRGALDDVIAGRFEEAVQKCNREWASLPGSPYGQPVATLDEARAHYEAHGGAYTLA